MEVTQHSMKTVHKYLKTNQQQHKPWILVSVINPPIIFILLCITYILANLF